MTMVLAICVAVTFAVSIYLMLGRELKGLAMPQTSRSLR